MVLFVAQRSSCLKIAQSSPQHEQLGGVYRFTVQLVKLADTVSARERLKVSFFIPVFRAIAYLSALAFT